MPSKEREELQRMIAGILDHPSVYMGGPSRQNMRRADKIISTIRAALQEPTEAVVCAVDHDDCATPDNAQRAWRSMLAASALGEQSNG